MGWSDLAGDPFVIEPNQQGDFQVICETLYSPNTLLNPLNPIRNLDRILPAHWPRVLTLRRLFEDHLDMFSVPRRSFFEILAFFTQDQRQTEKLREFASAAGQV